MFCSLRNASAELGCFRVLGWPMPVNILDLFIEFRDRTNGLTTPTGSSLIGALTYFGLDTIGAQEKTEMRELAMRGGSYSELERAALLDYCESNVAALQNLLPAMLPRIDLPRALLRGRYMAAAAAMEHNGVPIDTATLELLRAHWGDIQDDLIRAVDDHGIYDGRTFKMDRWVRLLASKGIPWPMLESGQLDLGDGTFRQMAKAYAVVSPYRELRSALSDLRLNDWQGWPQSHNPLSLQIPHRTKSAEQFEIHFRPERMAARSDPAAAGIRHCLCGLVATGVRHRGGVVGRSRHAGGVFIGRPVSGLCQAGGRRARGRHQDLARVYTRAFQDVRTRGAVRHGVGQPGPPSRSAADYRA
jgi:hypothetical protein